MQQQISVITLGIDDLSRSRRFYTEGFGWTPVFENAEIVFYQMNGLMLGTWLKSGLASDSGVYASGTGGFALAHNVPEQADVEPVMAALMAAGGKLTGQADAPLHGGFRGYVSDPDGHLWEVAWNPVWTIDAQGHVTFGV
ncbi:VOC family protein [Asticcacaulis sp. BYS171W]|uniref:VOC family protein n=1 Tax=Asticcacaulis aquaticus TaxID=2984212 RepID=A0ABT5HQG9_9CAUL|nr:VOC family protein [Asticcacaulis aquaticus]MDC7682193.1 VOC family protein [Asticcacaulis aquaticus]